MARAVEIERSSPGFLKLAVAFFLGAMAILFVEHTLRPATGKAVAASAKNIRDEAVTTDKPWGRLDITSIPFENSEEIFLDHAARLKKPEWVFEGGTPEQLVQFFKSANLTDAQERALLATNTWTVNATNCVVYPSDEAVLSLSSKAREKIYWALSQCQSNYSQCFPFRFVPNRFEERFANSGLGQQTISFVRGLCYTNDGLLSFCDLGVASKKLNKSEFDALIRVLYAVPTVRVRLRVGPNDDIERLVKYWGKGGREKRVRPMLESVAHLPGGDSVAIPYLLPGSARLRLYTFPDVTRDAAEAREDCFFSALNFFNKYADEKFLDKNNTRQALQNDYTVVNEPPTYGDLITLFDTHGDAVHVAVYIAENIVFTKNGVNLLQPWVLMRMDDMMSYFPSPEPLRIVIFRKKEFTQVTVGT
jgi:hypothetical protein